MCSPRMRQGQQSDHKYGKREPQINTKAKQLVSYPFVLGRLENTRLHLVGSHTTHKVTSHARKAIDCFLGRAVKVTWV